VYDELKRNCSFCPAILAYFDKNWLSCREMWSNYARNTTFTAGNTTTNRVEANWNLLKMSMSKRTRIDKAVAGLLNHQISIIRQQLTAIRDNSGKSRDPASVPDFLRRVSGRLCDYTLDKIRRQWESFVTDGDDVSCVQDDEKSWIWRVWKGVRWFDCDDLSWKCTCLFFTSHHLPCQHLMHVAVKSGFQDLPTLALGTRWSMTTMGALAPAMEESVVALALVADMAKIKASDIVTNERMTSDATLPSASATLSKSDRLNLKPGAVVYARLRRREKGNMIVLSSQEKYSYARAVIEPLLEHMSELSSVNFYKELRFLQDIVTSTLDATSTLAGATTPADESASSGQDDGTNSENGLPVPLDFSFEPAHDSLSDDDYRQAKSLGYSQRALGVNTPGSGRVRGRSDKTGVPTGESAAGNDASQNGDEQQELTDKKSAEGHICAIQRTGQEDEMPSLSSLSSLSDVSFPVLDISEASQVIIDCWINPDNSSGGDVPATHPATQDVQQCLVQPDAKVGHEALQHAALGPLVLAAEIVTQPDMKSMVFQPDVAVMELAALSTDSESHGPDKDTQTVDQRGRLEMLKLPAPKYISNTRTKKKQGWTTPATRLEAIQYPDGPDVSVATLIQWANHMRMAKTVISMLEKYPVAFDQPFLVKRIPKCKLALIDPSAFQFKFVIPQKLVNRMQASYAAAQSTATVHYRQPDPDVVLVDSATPHEGFVVSLAPGLAAFSGYVLNVFLYGTGNLMLEQPYEGVTQPY